MHRRVTQPRRAARRLLDRVRWRGEVLTVLQGPAAGLRIGGRNASADYAEGINELPVQEALTRLLPPGGTFFDVGANIGFFSLLAARVVGSTGRVVAFEAVPDIAASLAHNVRMNGFAQVEVRAVAVGAEPGRSVLRLTSHPGGATLADDPDAGDIIDTAPTEVVSIDALVAAGAVPIPDVVKIDVEGHEREALAGMSGLLTDHGPTLVVELDAATPHRLAGKRVSIERHLDGLGYQVEALAPSYPDTDWEVVHLVAVR